MVSLQRYHSKGRTYYRLVESYRDAKGRPRTRVIKHLGTAETVQQGLQGEAGPVRVHSQQHGDVAALWHAAQRLGIPALINQHAGRTRRGLDVGTSIVLIAINRALAPTSKRDWHNWARTTTLPQLVRGLDVDELTSQYFWDQMDALGEAQLPRIESALTKTLLHELQVSLDTLLYDVTNFHTYIASDNRRNTIAQRGKNKQHRNDLRQVNVALLVARTAGIPLLSTTYRGNTVDVTRFPQTITAVRTRLAEIGASLQALTLVYDRGNNSQQNQRLVDEEKIHYVGALTPTQHRKLLPGLPETGVELASPFEGRRARRFQAELWGATRTFVLYRSPTLRDGQVRGLAQHMTKALAKLGEWQDRLANPTAGPRSPENAEKQIADMLAAQHLKQVLHATYHPDAQGRDRLRVTQDMDAVRRLKEQDFGLRLLMTDQHGWTTEQIIQAYHGQSDVERVFRDCKDDDHFALRPQYHWTDQKIHVHVFTCLLAYLLAKVVEHEARKLGYKESLQTLLEELGRVRVATLATRGGTRGRPRTQRVLEDQPAHAVELFRGLVPQTAPFVHTVSAALSG